MLPFSPVSCQCRDVSAAITLVLGRLLLGKLLCFPSVKCLFCSAHFPKIFLALSQLYQKRADCPSLRGDFCPVCSFVIIVKAGLDHLLVKASVFVLSGFETGSHQVAQAGFELIISLFQPRKCWGCRHVAIYSVLFSFSSIVYAFTQRTLKQSCKPLHIIITSFIYVIPGRLLDTGHK